jgi:hypothetical protein
MRMNHITLDEPKSCIFLRIEYTTIAIIIIINDVSILLVVNN